MDIFEVFLFRFAEERRRIGAIVFREVFPSDIVEAFLQREVTGVVVEGIRLADEGCVPPLILSSFALREPLVSDAKDLPSVLIDFSVVDPFGIIAPVDGVEFPAFEKSLFL